MSNQPHLQIEGLDKFFNVPKGVLKAVNNVSFSVERGRTIGVVGESGCGKSTLGKTILRIHQPTAGKILLNGEDIMQMTKQQQKSYYQKMQMIFQDPNACINPRMSVADVIGDPLKVNKLTSSKAELEAKVDDLMETVGLAQRLYGAYPHELDGGRLQRVGIARALALNPEFIVCDEPVSALDVSIQAQILNLLMDLQDEKKLTYLFITHDLSVVRHISNTIMVMYLGHCVEMAPTKELFENPQHPYTKALLAAIPKIDLAFRKSGKKRQLIQGELVSPINPKPGCPFAARCDYVTDQCIGEDLELKDLGNNHCVACRLFE